jgi:hypothetical protein
MMRMIVSIYGILVAAVMAFLGTLILSSCSKKNSLLAPNSSMVIKGAGIAAITATPTTTPAKTPTVIPTLVNNCLASGDATDNSGAVIVTSWVGCPLSAMPNLQNLSCGSWVSATSYAMLSDVPVPLPVNWVGTMPPQILKYTRYFQILTPTALKDGVFRLSVDSATGYSTVWINGQEFSSSMIGCTSTQIPNSFFQLGLNDFTIESQNLNSYPYVDVSSGCGGFPANEYPIVAQEYEF